MIANDRAPDGVVRVRAPNPSVLTLDGTNTYVVDGWVVDPGPLIDEHLDAIVRAAGSRGVVGVLLTHSHVDHSEGAEALAERVGGVPVVLPDGDAEVGPFRVIATPGHAPDHVSLLWRRVLFSGDTLLGEGSVFVGAGEGSMAHYFASLKRLLELDLDAICPGHGPFVWNPRERMEQQLAHRLERERKVLDAIEAGAGTLDDVLDAAWADTDLTVHPMLREAAKLTLEAHRVKLRAEGAVPPGAPAPRPEFR